jgi:predicted dehydrogenase
MENSIVRIGVLGYGYWGPNIVRNFNLVKNAKVVMVCDPNTDSLSHASLDHPQIRVSTDVEGMLTGSEVDCIAIVTPVSTHFDLAKKALENGKHIFVEKPFTTTTHQAEELINIAEKKKLKIMVDHTFLFTGAVKKMKDLIDKNDLGSIYYYDSTRVNLGLFQRDVNVIWDLAPHDFSIMLYLLKDRPDAVRAFGKSHVNHMEDIAYIFVYFTNNLVAHFHVNWLSPVKIRSTMIGGDKRMLIWNDISSDEKIKIYDKGVDVKTRAGMHQRLVNYRSGDMWSPSIDQREALFLELSHFVECIHEDKPNESDGTVGLEVVRLLQSCEKSIKHNGALVII